MSAPVPTDEWVPSARLRFVPGGPPGNGYAMILQQWFERWVPAGVGKIDRGEWRDVPIEKEST